MGMAIATGKKIPRRLIAERRIRFVRVGGHVRIQESALSEFLAAGVVEPASRPRGRGPVAYAQGS